VKYLTISIAKFFLYICVARPSNYQEIRLST